MKYSLSPWETPRASPLGFPSSLGYIPSYIPTLVTIQIHYSKIFTKLYLAYSLPRLIQNKSQNYIFSNGLLVFFSYDFYFRDLVMSGNFLNMAGFTCTILLFVGRENQSQNNTIYEIFLYYRRPFVVPFSCSQTNTILRDIAQTSSVFCPCNLWTNAMLEDIVLYSLLLHYTVFLLCTHTNTSLDSSEIIFGWFLWTFVQQSPHMHMYCVQSMYSVYCMHSQYQAGQTDYRMQLNIFKHYKEHLPLSFLSIYPNMYIS